MELTAVKHGKRLRRHSFSSIEESAKEVAPAAGMKQETCKRSSSSVVDQGNGSPPAKRVATGSQLATSSSNLDSSSASKERTRDYVCLPQDPVKWTATHVAQWVDWAQGEFNLDPIDLSKFDIDGTQLCLLTKEDFLQRCPAYTGDVLHSHLCLLRARNSALSKGGVESAKAFQDSKVASYSMAWSPYIWPGTFGDLWLKAQQELSGHAAAVSTPNPDHMYLPQLRGSMTHAFYPGSMPPLMTPVTLSYPVPGSPNHLYRDIDWATFAAAMKGQASSLPKDVITLAYKRGQPSVKLPQLAGSKSEITNESGALSASGGDSAHLMGQNDQSMMSHSSPISPFHTQQGGQIQLWQFLLELLQDKQHSNIITWAGNEGEFKLLDPEAVSLLWGHRKRKPSMNYDKLSRAIRYYYDKKIMHKVHGKRYVYKFNFDTISKYLSSGTSQSAIPTDSVLQQSQDQHQASSPLSSVIADLQRVQQVSAISETPINKLDTNSSVQMLQNAVSNISESKASVSSLEQQLMAQASSMTIPSINLNPQVPVFNLSPMANAGNGSKPEQMKNNESSS